MRDEDRRRCQFQRAVLAEYQATEMPKLDLSDPLEVLMEFRHSSEGLVEALQATPRSQHRRVVRTYCSILAAICLRGFECLTPPPVPPAAQPNGG